MKKKVTLISLVLIGFVFVFSGSAWAGRDFRPGHHYQKWHNNGGHHYKRHDGWRHGRGKHFSPRYRAPKWHNNGGRYYKRHHGWRHGRGKYFGPRHRDRRPHYYRRTIEKHVYHHSSSDDSYASDDQYQVAGTLGDPGFSFSFGISGSR
jgi:hypothetical protein